MGDTEGGGGCVWGGISDLLSATLGLGQGVGGGRSGCSIRPYSGCGWRGAGCRVQGAQTLASAIVIARSAWNESSASARSTPSWWGVAEFVDLPAKPCRAYSSRITDDQRYKVGLLVVTKLRHHPVIAQMFAVV